MKSWIATGLLLLTTAAVMASELLRVATLEQLRTLAEPLFERGQSTEPRFDRFHAAIVENMSPRNM